MSKCVSICIPFYNEEKNVSKIYYEIKDVLDRLSYKWELVCVNDGSCDMTLKELIKLHQEDHRIRVFDFSRNFGKEAAITAALRFCVGDCAILMDADMQHPPSFIPNLLARWEEGYDIVNAVRDTRAGESRIKKIAAFLFYKISKLLTQVKIPENIGDFRLFSRSVIDVLNQLPERRRFMKGLFAWVGFNTASIIYTQQSRIHGRTKWNYWRLWNYAIEGLTSFSQIPLQVASYLGFIISVSSFLYGFWILVKTIIFGNSVKGYPSLIVSFLFIGGVQLIFLGIIGEYLGRIYDEVKQRPMFIVQKKWDHRNGFVGDRGAANGSPEPMHQYDP